MCENMGLLDGKFVLIAGGSSGIGSATASLFAKEGAKGIGVHYSSSPDRAEKVTSEVRKHTEVVTLKSDVSKYNEVKRIADEFVKKWKRIDVIVNFAGATSSKESWYRNPLDIPDKEFLEPFMIDFLGSYHFIRAVADQMRDQGGGKIILTSSSPTIVGEPEGFSFTVAKDGIRMLVKSLSPILIKDFGIYLNAIAPGTIETSANRMNYSDNEWNQLIKQIPLRRSVQPEEIAKVALFLSSDLSNGMVGQTIIADGGEVRL